MIHDIQIIKFTDTVGISKQYYPVPASQVIPDWYKNLESYIGGEKTVTYFTVDGKKRPDSSLRTTSTAKRCMPVFDAMINGYIIFTHADLFISQKLDQNGQLNPHYECSNSNYLSFHPKQQLPKHPEAKENETLYPKWNNAWSISTPAGYSCLFIPPLHRETPIVALSAVVDTDKYTAPVYFPFVLKDPTMSGLIPAGTPIMQVIPFKRDSFKMEIGNQEQLKQQENITNKLRTIFFDSYKNQFRQSKRYN